MMKILIRVLIVLAVSVGIWFFYFKNTDISVSNTSPNIIKTEKDLGDELFVTVRYDSVIELLSKVGISKSKITPIGNSVKISLTSVEYKDIFNYGDKTISYDSVLVIPIEIINDIRYLKIKAGYLGSIFYQNYSCQPAPHQ